MNQEESLLPSQPLERRHPSNLLQKIRFKWARFIKRFAVHCRHSRSRFKLAMCMRGNAPHHRRAFKGNKDDASCFPLFSSGRRFRFRKLRWRHKNRPLFSSLRSHPLFDDPNMGDSLAFSPLQKHQDWFYHDDDDEDKLSFAHHKDMDHVNAPLQRLHLQERSNEDGDGLVSQTSLKQKEKSHDVDDGSKRHNLEWKHRMEKGLAKRVNKPLSRSSHNKRAVPRDVPRGYVGIYVGEEHRRFVVPVMHLNHPIFEHLLNSMYHEYGHPEPGPLYFPCEVSEFQSLHSQIKHPTKIRKGYHTFTKPKLTQARLSKHSSESRIDLHAQ